MRRSPLTAPSMVSAALVLSLALAGCGTGSDPVDGAIDGAIDTDWFGAAPPSDILAAATDSMAEPVALRLQQQARSRGGVISKDLAVGADGECTGQLQLPAWGEPAELVVSDGEGAFRGSRLFWFTIGLDLGDDPLAALRLRTDLVERYGDHWTSTPGLETLCEVDDFLRPVATAARDDGLVKAGLSDVDGEPAGRVVSQGRRRDVTIWVALAEPHRVLRIAIVKGAGTDGPVGAVGDSVTSFSDFGVPVEVVFPSATDIEPFEPPAAG